MDILTNFISLIFRSHLQKIERYADSCDVIQRNQLNRLISEAQQTEWGKKHDFKNIKTYKDFAEKVPLQTYDSLKMFIQRMVNGEKDVLWPGEVRWFAKSSGTTNDKSKFIPVTEDILNGCHYRGGSDVAALYLRNNPSSRLFSHQGLILGGSHSPSPLNRHAHCGDLSAVLLQNLNPLVSVIRTPRKKIVLMDEWESKMKAIVENTWKKDVSSLSGVPSWMLVLIKAVIKRAGCSYLTEVWPNMEVFFHGGINFGPYRGEYKTLIPSSNMHYMETYNASEGFFGIQDDPSDSSMLLMLDYGVFYEFIPFAEVGTANPTILPIEEVSTGVDYAMVISTSGGLWRYQIGDTIRFTSLSPHTFVITGRTRHFINACGEDLMVSDAEKAICDVCQETGARVKEYTAAPLFLLGDAKGRHQWLIEFEIMPPSLEDFTEKLDRALKSINSDYEAKRYKGISLLPPEVIIAHEGAFYQWLKKNDKLGGQHKVPRMSNDRKMLDELLEINRSMEQ